MNRKALTLRRRLTAAAQAAALALALGVTIPAAAAADDGLPGQVAAITSKLVGRIGFAAQLLDGDGALVALNGDQAFPMASTFKLAVAGKILSMVDTGELSLDRMVEVPVETYVPSPVIASSFIHPGVMLSVANLVEAMIVTSDNTAADTLLALAGGPAAVTAWLRDIGIVGMRIDRSTAELAHEVYGFTPGGDTSPATGQDDHHVPDPNDPAIPALESDPRDHATPADTLRLLVLLDRGGTLSPGSRDFLLGAMGRTVTGPNRIRGLLPRDTPVAHKTGTIAGVANDAGFVTLPDGRRFAIAIFTSGSTTPPPDRERAVAETARTLYDFFALQ